MTNDDIVDEEKAEQIMSMLTETEWYVVGMNCLLLTKLKVKEIMYYYMLQTMLYTQVAS